MRSTIILGGGPGGLGPLIWAAQQGLLPSWLARGVALVDRQETLGGTLGRFGINSDSLGGSYLECLDAIDLPRSFRRLRTSAVTRDMARYRDSFPPLTLVHCYMHQLGDAIESEFRGHPQACFLGGSEATTLRLQRDSSVRVDVLAADGSPKVLNARSAIVALGGRQALSSGQLVPGLALSDCRVDTLMPSDRLLSRIGLQEASQVMASAGSRPIVILGGSHSGYSAAWALLQQPAARHLLPGQIVILQRRVPPVFYADRAAAEADGYAINPGDICPRTGRVHRLGGLRGNGRDLWRQVARRPGAIPEPRVAVGKLERFDASWLQATLEEAALVVTAFGYNAATLPMHDADGRRLVLSADCGGVSVDDHCRIMLADGSALPNVFGIGLGSGFRPSGSMGGEPNFRGQANSLWLYQHDIGAVIYRGIEALIQPRALLEPVAAE